MLIIGFHAVTDLIEKTGFSAGDKLVIARQAHDGRMQKILSKAERANIQVIRKDYGALNTIAGTKNHQGIVLEREGETGLKSFTKQDFVESVNGIYLGLDGVQDPQNLGAIFRSALGLGVRGVFLPQKDSAPAGPTAIKASAGALLEMPICFTGSIASLMQYIEDKRPEVPRIALDQSGEAFSATDADELGGTAQPVLLVVGSEQGISRLALERATHRRRLRISDRLESYNVSVATALALYELTKSTEIE